VDGGGRLSSVRLGWILKNESCRKSSGCISGGEDAMFETDCAAYLRARKDAERLDLNVLVRSLVGIGLRDGDRFRGVLSSGDEDIGDSMSRMCSSG
jgi:hypothetical protein